MTGIRTGHGAFMLPIISTLETLFVFLGKEFREGTYQAPRG
jgi:hypothetical protein